jgi:glycosyltransferase involved in cell wall biosynthesis
MGRTAIFIPAYNAAGTLSETLQSIQCQTLAGLQRIDRVVVADDGSTDDTIASARTAWSLAAPTLEVWPNARNMGERATCNASFRRLMAEGVEWCFVLHADDLAKPHWLESLYAMTLDQNPSLTSLCSSWDDWHGGGDLVPGEDNPQRAIDLVAGTPEAARGTLRRGCWWHFSGSAMHLPRFFRVGAFDETMPQLGDLEWVVRCLLAGHDIAYLPRTLITYRAAGTSVSSLSFRTNRDLRESAYIVEVHGRDGRLAPAIRQFLCARLRLSSRRVAGHLLRGNVRGAASAARWAVHFAVRCSRRMPS